MAHEFVQTAFEGRCWCDYSMVSYVDVTPARVIQKILLSLRLLIKISKLVTMHFITQNSFKKTIISSTVGPNWPGPISLRFK